MGATMHVKRSLGLSVLVISVLSLPFFFQNCSPIQFNRDYSSQGILGTPVSSNGAYTNSRVLPIEIEVTGDDYTEVRASIYEDMDAKAVPWVKLDGSKVLKLDVDLAEQYAGDGSLDGKKIIYVQGRDPLTNVVAKASTEAFLDTQTPKIEIQGILKNGIQGRLMSKGEMVSLFWDSSDVPASSGYSSGIVGFRWGVSENGDCSDANLVSDSGWKENVNSMEVAWPEGDPLKAFYFCLFVKDKASNVGPGFSQPMTSLWNVIAGDNAQGNGSSVTSNKVRFKLPYYLHLDVKGDIQFYDNAFNSYRKIKDFANDRSRTIEQSDAIPYSSAPVLDKNKNMYFEANGTVYMIPAGESAGKQFILKDPSNPSFVFAIRNYKGVESLLIGRSKLMDSSLDCNCYLMEIPTSAIPALAAAPISITAALTNYKIAGNGYNAPTDFGAFTDEKLGKNDYSSTPNYRKSLGFINGLVASANGDIYVATGADGAARNWGVHSVRRLVPNNDAEKSFTQKLLSNALEAPQTAFIKSLAYRRQVAADGSIQEYVFVGHAYGTTVINLQKNFEKTQPFAETQLAIKNSQITTALVVPILGGTDYEIYLGSGTESKIYRYDSKFKLIEALGRGLDDVNPENALASVLGNPDGLTVDEESGDVYVVDSQTGVIQNVQPDGKMAKVWGNYSDNGHFLSGYTYRLVGDFNAAKNRKVLYFNPNFNSSIYQRAKKFDLNSKTESFLYDTVGTTNPDRIFDYTIGSFALVKDGSDNNTLLIKRNYPIQTDTAYNEGFTSFVQKLNINAGVLDAASKSNFLGDVMKGDAQKDSVVRSPSVILNSSAIIPSNMDSKVVHDGGLIYTSGNFFLISRLGSAESRMMNWRLETNFTVVNGGGGIRYIIFRNGVTLGSLKIDVSKVFDSTVNPILEPYKKLCFPGSQLRGVRDITQDQDGNLLISDSSNARVLRYRIRDGAGALKFSYCP
jgi:hypothetical protein